jgi:CsoR family transcriptional regulator, copper-sensing transcriptional repressor
MSQSPSASEPEASTASCHPRAPLDAGEYQGHSYHQDKAKITARLKRIEGQVRGISRMVDEEQYCIDILTQVSAVMASMRSVGMLVLEDHIRGCVMNVDPDRREDTLVELNQAIERFVRSVGN